MVSIGRDGEEASRHAFGRLWTRGGRLNLEMRYGIVAVGFQASLLRPNIDYGTQLRTLPVNRTAVDVVIAEYREKPANPSQRPVVGYLESLQGRSSRMFGLKVAHLVAGQQIKPAFLAAAHKLI